MHIDSDRPRGGKIFIYMAFFGFLCLLIIAPLSFLPPDSRSFIIRFQRNSTFAPSEGLRRISKTPTTTRPPTLGPSLNPTKAPLNPTKAPLNPTKAPSLNPTRHPTKNPSKNPTKNPTKIPTLGPSFVTRQPSLGPTLHPQTLP
jgi:hypothetical protein